jgi:hypothetical protein
VAFALSYELLLALIRPASSEPGEPGEPAPAEWEIPAPGADPAPSGWAVAPAQRTAPPAPAPTPRSERETPAPATTQLGVSPLASGRASPPPPAPTEHQPAPAPVAAVGEGRDDDEVLAARAAELIAAADGRAPGRRVLARELGCSEHKARVLPDAVTANGTNSTARSNSSTNGRGGSR